MQSVVDIRNSDELNEQATLARVRDPRVRERILAKTLISILRRTVSRYQLFVI